MRKFNKSQKSNASFKINDEIVGYSNVRIIGDGIKSEVVPLLEAKRIGEEMGMDIILMNDKITPPIVKIASYDKMIYEMKKNAKKNKMQSNSLKEIQLSVNIASNDLNTKARKAKEFIEDGDKVKVVLTMKGRELSRRDENKRSIFEFITILEDVAVPESMPRDEGNKTIVILKKK